MSIRPEFRWWILTVVIVALLLGISALALDRPNVIWEQGRPVCPHCRADAASYATRCQTCDERYDWTVAPDEQSPISAFSLGALEAEWLRGRTSTLGREVAAQRVSGALGVRPEAAQAYVDRIGRGLCGWCGGTGRDLEAQGEDVPCPVCFGGGRCIACGGDRRIRVGDEAAHRALLAYQEAANDLARVQVPEPGIRREEVRRLTEDFVRRHAGTSEATQIQFWPLWPGNRPAVAEARTRLDRVLRALAE